MLLEVEIIINVECKDVYFLPYKISRGNEFTNKATKAVKDVSLITRTEPAGRFVFSCCENENVKY